MVLTSFSLKCCVPPSSSWFILVSSTPSLVLPLLNPWGTGCGTSAFVLGPALTQQGSVDVEKGQDSPPGQDRTEEDVTEGRKIPSETGKPNKQQPCVPSPRMWLKGHQMNP